jgi:hypothetical protein
MLLEYFATLGAGTKRLKELTVEKRVTVYEAMKTSLSLEI